LTPLPSMAQEAEAPAEAAPADDGASLEEHFADYLHFALIGRFDVADSHAQALLAHPELNPLSDEGAERLLALTDKHEKSLDTLVRIIDNGTDGENAKNGEDLIAEAHRRERLKPSRTLGHIRLHAGAA